MKAATSYRPFKVAAGANRSSKLERKISAATMLILWPPMPSSACNYRAWNESSFGQLMKGGFAFTKDKIGGESAFSRE
jgi:hypothetical protein